MEEHQETQEDKKAMAVLFGELPVGRSFVSRGMCFEKVSSIQAVYTEDNKCCPVDFGETDEVFVDEVK